jgi:hydrogenase maturation protease
MAIKIPILIIGLGNRYRKDDGVGLYVAERIKALNHDGIKVINNISDGAALMETWSEAEEVFIIDAVTFGASLATVYRFDALSENIPGEIFSGYSTHSLNLIELAKSLEELPHSLVIYGIRGSDFSTGIGLTSEVKSAALNVIDSLKGEIETLLGEKIGGH